MAVIAESWQRRRPARQAGGVVATVMSNLGPRALSRRRSGLTLARTAVGDRYVLEHMREHGFNVGGEQSGHIILSDYATTGDGLVAALQVLAVVQEAGQAGVARSATASSRCRRSCATSATRAASRSRTPRSGWPSTSAEQKLNGHGPAGDPPLRHRAGDPGDGRGRRQVPGRGRGRRHRRGADRRRRLSLRARLFRLSASARARRRAGRAGRARDRRGCAEAANRRRRAAACARRDRDRARGRRRSVRLGRGAGARRRRRDAEPRRPAAGDRRARQRRHRRGHAQAARRSLRTSSISGRKDLKGVAGPMRAFAALRREFAARAASRRCTQRGLTALVGREEEIELLLRRWAKAKAGEGQVVLLSGEAGIGKSRLTAAFAGAARRRAAYAAALFLLAATHRQRALSDHRPHRARSRASRARTTPKTKLDKLDALLAQTSTLAARTPRFWPSCCPCRTTAAIPRSNLAAAAAAADERWKR